jgi:hypothetical protein
VTAKEILIWGIEQDTELMRVNCRLYEVRKLNYFYVDLKFTEPKPIYCEGITEDEQPKND